MKIEQLENLKVRKSSKNGKPTIHQSDRQKYKKLVTSVLYEELSRNFDPIKTTEGIAIEIWNESLEQFVTVMVCPKIKDLEYDAEEDLV